MLNCGLVRGGETIHESLAFNDMAMRTNNVLQIIEFELSIDDCFVLSQRADGIIVASPSGSTAYSLSSGGPIVNPRLCSFVIQSICPHTLSSRPLVVDADTKISVLVTEKKTVHAQMICDGQVYNGLQREDIIEVRRHEKPIRILHPSNYNYYAILREKLNWG